MVPLRFLQSWNGYDAGAEVNFPHPGLAEDLIRMRVAERRESEPPAPVPAEPKTKRKNPYAPLK